MRLGIALRLLVRRRKRGQARFGEPRKNPLLDPKRPLDKEGKKHCLQLAHVLNALNIQFDLIVSSPLKRCLQTASLVGTETGYEAQIRPRSAYRLQAIADLTAASMAQVVVDASRNIRGKQ